MQTLTILRPDDWHLHLRDGASLAAVLPASARQFARAIVMPNLRPPVTTTAQALAYRERILAELIEFANPAAIVNKAIVQDELTFIVKREYLRRFMTFLINDANCAS